MIRRVAYLTVVVGAAGVLAGCAFPFFGAFEQRAAWHDQEERACMASRVVVASTSIEPTRRINDRGACGILAPLRVSATASGTVHIGPTATLNCPMTAAVEEWMMSAVQPAAIAWLGAPVVEIRQISAYACRPINNTAGENLSEHAYGNALDVAGFALANGRTVTVKQGWKGAADERGFLREVFAGACAMFKTTLGPGYPQHDDHFHLDLAHHGADGVSQICRPTPEVAPLQRPPYGGLVAERQPAWRTPLLPRVFDRRAVGSVPGLSAYSDD
jgi:hypothetical protein